MFCKVEGAPVALKIVPNRARYRRLNRSIEKEWSLRAQNEHQPSNWSFDHPAAFFLFLIHRRIEHLSYQSAGQILHTVEPFFKAAEFASIARAISNQQRFLERRTTRFVRIGVEPIPQDPNQSETSFNTVGYRSSIWCVSPSMICDLFLASLADSSCLAFPQLPLSLLNAAQNKPMVGHLTLSPH